MIALCSDLFVYNDRPVLSDPEKLAALLSKTIHEAHARTCLLTREQIQELWLQDVDQQKLFLFKNMVRKNPQLLIPFFV